MNRIKSIDQNQSINTYNSFQQNDRKGISLSFLLGEGNPEIGLHILNIEQLDIIP